MRTNLGKNGQKCMAAENCRGYRSAEQEDGDLGQGPLDPTSKTDLEKVLETLKSDVGEAPPSQIFYCIFGMLAKSYA